jgi:hypothetical protein
MKITIKTGNVVKNSVTIHGLITKLNALVRASSGDFFHFKSDSPDRIHFRSNANVEVHSKLVCVVGLYLIAQYPKHGCYIGFIDSEDGVGYFELSKLPLSKFEDFLSSIGDIRNVTTEIV